MAVIKKNYLLNLLFLILLSTAKLSFNMNCCLKYIERTFNFWTKIMYI